MNRQIRNDNALLRELKELVNRLSEAALNTAAKIAAKLENIRNNLITVFYEIRHNSNTADEIQHDNLAIDIIMREYNKVVKAIDETGTELTKLKTEKAALNQIHIFKHNSLSEQIGELEAKLKKFKQRKNVLLNDMHCKSETDIPKIKERRNSNDIVFDNISNRNDKLNKNIDITKADFRNIKGNIPPEDVAAVQEERCRIRDDAINVVIKNLKDTYGNKYSYDIFKYTEADVDYDLRERPLSKKSIRKQLQHKHQKSIPLKYKYSEIENK